MIASGVQAYLESLDVDVAEGEALFRLLQRLGKIDGEKMFMRFFMVIHIGISPTMGM